MGIEGEMVPKGRGSEDGGGLSVCCREQGKPSRWGREYAPVARLCTGARADAAMLTNGGLAPCSASIIPPAAPLTALRPCWTPQVAILTYRFTLNNMRNWMVFWLRAAMFIGLSLCLGTIFLWVTACVILQRGG